MNLNKQNNYMLGIIGSIIGVLLGVAIWIVIYQLGYIAGLAGFAMGSFALKGYQKLGGELDKKAVITTIIILIVSIFLVNWTCWSIESYKALKVNGWTFAGCFVNLWYILKQIEATGNFAADIIVGYLLTVLATFKMYTQVLKNLKENNSENPLNGLEKAKEYNL